jgi:uncharacterized membrane protein YdjX (TVP38/TMEM64 family)
MPAEHYSLLLSFVEKQDFYTAFLSLTLLKTLASAFFLPGTPFTILSGTLLGTFWGSISAIIGNTIGAILAFTISRYFLYNFVQKKILTKYPKIKEYEEKLFKNGLQTVLFLRLIPLFPFNVLNCLLAITKVKFKDYFWGTFIGIIPGTIAFVYLGDSIKMFSWLNVLFALGGIVGLSYIGKFWKLK